MSETMVLVLAAVAIVVGVLLLVLPWAIAARRQHAHSGLVLVVCLLLGWTIVGWVAALIWAFLGSPRWGPPKRAVPWREVRRGEDLRPSGPRPDIRPVPQGEFRRAKFPAATRDR